MTRVLRSSLLALVVAFGPQGCGINLGTPPEPERFDRLVRIFLHERDMSNNHSTYTIWYPSEQSDEIQMRTFTCRNENIHVFVDVHDEGDQAWALYRPRTDSRHPENLNFHLRAVEEVIGGGWNHGKFGSGRTEAIDPNAVGIPALN